MIRQLTRRIRRGCWCGPRCCWRPPRCCWRCLPGAWDAGRPADLYTLDPAELEGRYVAARVDLIYALYAETVRGRGDRAQTVRREYIIPVGQDAFMGMEVTSGQIPAAQAVLETTAAVMRGEAGALDGSSLVVYGTVRQMDPYTRTFYEDVAGVSRFSAADQARFLPLVLVEGQVGRYSLPLLLAGLAAGAGCGLAGAVFLVRGLLCRGPVQPAAYLAGAAGDAAPLLDRELSDFYRQTPPVGRLRANCRWLLCEDGSASWLLYNRDVAWVYRRRSGRRQAVIVCARSPLGRRLRGATASRYTLPARPKPCWPCCIRFCRRQCSATALGGRPATRPIPPVFAARSRPNRPPPAPLPPAVPLKAARHPLSGPLPKRQISPARCVDSGRGCLFRAGFSVYCKGAAAGLMPAVPPARARRSTGRLPARMLCRSGLP